MKLAIIGSRDFKNYPLLKETVLKHFVGYDTKTCMEVWPEEIVSGGANGADSLAKAFALEYGIPLKEFIPEWEKYGKRAGFLRNQDIVKRADWVLCFWDGQSKGSGNSLSIAKKLKKPTLIIYF